VSEVPVVIKTAEVRDRNTTLFKIYLVGLLSDRRMWWACLGWYAGAGGW